MSSSLSGRVLWSKGLVLTPQHLQAHDRYLERVLRLGLESAMRLPWGFSDLEVGKLQLEEGTVTLERAIGVFPDGLPFSVPAQDAPPPPIALEALEEDAEEYTDLFLAVPEYRLGARNVSMLGNDPDARFAAETRMVRDENTGRGERRIQVARKNLRLLTQRQSRDGFVTLPIGRVRRGPGGQLEADPLVIPPLMRVRASEQLQTRVEKLANTVLAKSESLSRLRRDLGQGLATFGQSDVQNFWLLYTVNSYLPELLAAASGSDRSPVDLYEHLLGLAGALATFQPETSLDALPKYDHLRLGQCFGELDRKIRLLLETVVPKHHASLTLTPTDARAIHGISIDDDAHLNAPTVYLCVTSTSGVREIRAAVERRRLVKATSPSRIDQVVNQALPGVELTFVENPPTSLPLKSDGAYFEVNQSDDHWQAVRRARAIAAYVPAEIEEPLVELVFLLPKD